MCVYCMIADWANKHIQPQPPYQWPVVAPPFPAPYTPPPAPSPWTQKMLDEFRELIERVRVLEEKVDPCPCPDASKLNFLDAIQKQLDAERDRLKGKPEKKTKPSAAK